jgi:hypothetical protein
MDCTLTRQQAKTGVQYELKYGGNQEFPDLGCLLDRSTVPVAAGPLRQLRTDDHAHKSLIDGGREEYSTEPGSRNLHLSFSGDQAVAKNEGTIDAHKMR